MIEPVDMPFGMWTWIGPRKHVLDGGAPGKCSWTVHVQRRCGLLSNYFESTTYYQGCTE